MAGNGGRNHAVRPRKPRKPYSLKRMSAKEKRRFALLAGAVLALIAFFIAAIATDFFSPSDGRLKMKNGAPAGAGEGAVILNMGEENSPIYYEIARVNGTLAGYEEKSDYQVSRDKNEKMRWFEAADAKADVFHYSVSGAHTNAEAAARGSAELRGILAEDGGIQGAISGALPDGRAYTGFILTQQDAEAYGGMWHKYLFAYVDAAHGASVVVNVSSKRDSEEALADDGALYSFMERVFETVEVTGA